jgi:hypothetical protein
MTEPVTLHNRSSLVERMRGWTSAPAHQSVHTGQLRNFVCCDVSDEYRTSTAMAGRLRRWCAAHVYSVGDGAVIGHVDRCLTEPVTVVLATTAGMPRQVLALVSISGGSPDVNADRTTDKSSWQATTTLAISCARGHTGAGVGGRYSRTAKGIAAHISRLFSLNRSVISRCRACEAFDDGTNQGLCAHPGFAVCCPACGERCRVTRPEIPVSEEN